MLTEVRPATNGRTATRRARYGLAVEPGPASRAEFRSFANRRSPKRASSRANPFRIGRRRCTPGTNGCFCAHHSRLSSHQPQHAFVVCYKALTTKLCRNLLARRRSRSPQKRVALFGWMLITALLKLGFLMEKSTKSASSEAAMRLKPEEVVRQKTIKELLALGWKEGQLQWKPEWQVPKTPHDLTKRERGQKYEVCGGEQTSLPLPTPAGRCTPF
jgi:hypothetical protein